MLGSWTPRLLEQLLPFWRPLDDSIRLTFRYDQSGIRLVGRVRRGKPAPSGAHGGRPVAPS